MLGEITDVTPIIVRRKDGLKRRVEFCYAKDVTKALAAELIKDALIEAVEGENDGESFTTTTKITFKSSHMVEAMATKITEILHQDQTIDFLFNRFIEQLKNCPQITLPNRVADGLPCQTPNSISDYARIYSPYTHYP